MRLLAARLQRCLPHPLAAGLVTMLHPPAVRASAAPPLHHLALDDLLRCRAGALLILCAAQSSADVVLFPFPNASGLRSCGPGVHPLRMAYYGKRSVRSGARDVSVMQPHLIRQAPHSTKLSAVILSENWLLEEYHLWPKVYNHLCAERGTGPTLTLDLCIVSRLTPRSGRRHPHGRAIRGQWRHNGAAPPPESGQKS